jgi:hypothetical protein
MRHPSGVALMISSLLTAYDWIYAPISFYDDFF